MKKLIPFFALLLSLGAHGQEFSQAYQSVSGLDPDIRDISELTGGDLVVGFDYQVDSASMPSAGIMKLDAVGNVIWSKVLAIENSDASCAFEVVETSTGDLLLYGLTKNSISGTMNAFLANLSASGAINSIREYPTASPLGGYAVNNMSLLPNDELLMLVNVFDRSIIIKADVNGDIIWGKEAVTDTISGGKFPGYDAKMLSTGEVVLTGKNQDRFFLAKFDASGNTVYMKKHQVDQYCQIKSFAENSQGRLFAAGAHSNSSSLSPLIMEIDPANGDILWTKTIDYSYDLFFGQEFLVDDDDGLLLSFSAFPDTLFAPGTPADASHLLKLDYDGNVLKTTQLVANTYLVDYPIIDKLGTDDYVYGGKLLESGNGTTYIQRVTDLISVNCMRVSDTNFTSTPIMTTNFPPTASISPYTAQTTPNVTTNNLSLNQSVVCVGLNTQKAKSQLWSAFYSSNSITYSLPGEIHTISYQIVSIEGRIIEVGTLSNQAGTIYVDNLASGTYVFTASINNRSETFKFVVPN